MVDTVYESRQIYQPKDIQVGEESVSDIGVPRPFLFPFHIYFDLLLIHWYL